MKIALIVASCGVTLALGSAGACTMLDDAPKQAAAAPESRKEPIRGTTLEIDLVKVPGSADGSIKPLWVARTETLWDWMDICIYKRDQKQGASESHEADACTRPTKPYTAADRGFGHNGFAAVSLSFESAKGFCTWLSAKTGRRYRLPTVAERRYLCARSGITADTMKDHAWTIENAKDATKPAGSLKPDASGLHDLYGNVREWCVAPDGTGVLMGGGYEDKAADIACDTALPNTEDWNASDPQFPKSVWWLADGPWAGFRIVCEE
jgi:formylglycine-generating enzyme required for sulfatase activity